MNSRIVNVHLEDNDEEFGRCQGIIYRRKERKKTELLVFKKKEYIFHILMVITITFRIAFMYFKLSNSIFNFAIKLVYFIYCNFV